MWEEAWSRIAADAIHLGHPMYMGHQVAPPLPHAVLADALASLLNNSVAVWEMSPTGTFVEGEVMRWMIELLGFPRRRDGTLVSGGQRREPHRAARGPRGRLPGPLAGRRGGHRGGDRAVVLRLRPLALLRRSGRWG